MTFGTIETMEKSKGRSITGIGGTQVARETTIIQIPPRSLAFFLDVEMLVIKRNGLTLLNLRDMLKNNLELFIKRTFPILQGRIQPLEMKNY